MSSISKAGIFIDVKQLLVFTQRMKEAMNVADRINYGDRLVGYNLDMITSFSLAYHRRDEHIIFTADGKTYDINLKGEKRKHVDDLEAAFDAYLSGEGLAFNLRPMSIDKGASLAEAVQAAVAAVEGQL